MSQVKLTLRPPPNVDFVHGYPGIPPTSMPDSQATVKGAIEVRTPATGVKAKWVRVELRKVETIPGGGTSNTFIDFVGPSPITLWTASDEFTQLRSHDFPFAIRIPESIPPSLALENKGGGAGVRYELVASVCTKGKSGFLRRNKSSVVSTSAPIIIDKHELHSTWAIYCQPETRQISQNGVTLTVHRNHNCYGPGDKITVTATLKSDSLHTIILRGFELTVRESTIFRAAPYTSGPGGGKKTAPMARVTTVAESKYPVNSELYGGTTKTQELSCHINPEHTTATLNAAKHIDITYVLSVKALMGTGTLTPLNMDLPIMLSNWPKSVSEEAVRRIGPVPTLSLLPPGSVPVASPSVPNISHSFAGRPSSSDLSFRPPVSQTYQGNGFPAAATIKADEFGRTPVNAVDRERDRDRKQRPSTGQSTTPAAPVDVTPAPVQPQATRRPNSSGGDTHQQSRFTIVNALPNELPAAEPRRHRSASGKVWPTAGDEKEKLFETAKAKVEKTQDMAARSITPPIEQPKPKPSSSKRWLTAEEEKARLYNQAQEAVKRTQDIVDYPEASGSSSAPKPAKTDNAPAPSSSFTSGRTFSSAQQEKEAMRLYHEATDRVNRAVNGNSPPQDAGALVTGLGGPVAYDSLYPSSVQSASPPPPVVHAPQPMTMNSDMPPPFETGAPRNAREQLDEKERMRREYERRDAEELARQQQEQQQQEAASSSVVPPYDPPPFSAGPSAAAVGEAISEKEALRRKFEQQDREAMAARGGYTSSPSPPSRHTSATAVMSRPTPVPPVGPGGFKPLTAVEEKAMLKYRYESENGASAGGSGSSYYQPASPPPPARILNGRNGTSTPPLSYSPSPKSSIPAPQTPPPLRPRPPPSYIAETQAEDARVSKYTLTGVFPSDDDTGHIKVNGSIFKAPGPPPPLPPKPADEA